MTVDSSALPVELTSLTRWVVWRYESRDGKPTKVPHSVRGGLASSTDERTWTTFDEANHARGAFDGVGFVFAKGDGFVGIDLDDCVHNGELSKDAAAIVAGFDTYAEISPSGSGVKLFMRGTLEGKTRRRDVKRGIEMYCEGRYFTVTGRRIDGHPCEVRDCQAAIDAFYASVFAKQEPEKRTAPAVPAAPSNLADAEVVQRASASKNGEKFRRLWGGDTSGYGTEDNAGHSEADLALCRMLAFWCGPGEASRVDALFRQSGLYRNKWERADYRTRTLNAAYSGMTEFYSPPHFLTHDDLVAAGLAMPETPRPSLGYTTPSEAASGGTRTEATVTTTAIPKPIVYPGHDADTNTLAGPREGVSNVEIKWIKDPDTGKAKPTKWYRQITEICAQVLKRCDGWPKSCGGLLFALNDRGGVRYLNDSEDVFSWIAGRVDLHWQQRGEVQSSVIGLATPATKGEFVSHLKASVPDRYSSVSELPHEPPIPGVYYLPYPKSEKQDGSALAAFLGMLNPATEQDRQLFLALLLTLAWGGPCGARPAFVISSKHGQGSGKSASAYAIGDLFGGVFNIPKGEDWEQTAKRLMSDRAMGKRLILKDNVKSKVAAEEVEAFITDPVISGWRPYHGDFSRPNYCTLVITSNVPNLGTDMADRAIEIHIGDRKSGRDFIREAQKFARERGTELVADLLARLRETPRGRLEPANRDRWGAWQEDVLSRCDDPNALAMLVAERRLHADSDKSEAEDIARAIDRWTLGKTQDRDGRYRITREDMRDILVSAGTIDAGASKRAAHGAICNMLGSHGPLANLVDTREGGSGTRCWMWTPPAPEIPV